MRQSEIDRTTGEHDECERGLGRVQAVSATDEETDLGIHSLDPTIADALFQGVVIRPGFSGVSTIPRPNHSARPLEVVQAPRPTT